MTKTLSEFKGTKGKWGTCGDGKYQMCVESKELGIRTICTVNTVSTVEETKANALLISKAPELLEEAILNADWLLHAAGLLEIRDDKDCKQIAAILRKRAERTKRVIKESTKIPAKNVENIRERRFRKNEL